MAWKVCPTCHGRTTVKKATTCTHCGGNGQEPGSEASGTNCTICHGSGTVDVDVTCPECGGSGHIGSES